MSIKDKKRVEEFGEVNTSMPEINGMLKLLETEVNRVDSRFYEPACGDGNFLVEILKRKIQLIEKKYSKNQILFERNLFLIVCNLYGVDILQDNVTCCRNRLINTIKESYERNFKNISNHKLFESLEFVISKNILCGDALTLKTVENNPIIFSEWSLVKNNFVKRINFKLSTILESESITNTPLFSDMGESIFMPTPFKTFKLQHFLELKDE